MSNHECPFCKLDFSRVFYQGTLIVALWDNFPVSPGHVLLIPKRHVATWFDASQEERSALVDSIQIAKFAIEERHKPDGFNIGFNVGEAGGQTVFHLHFHVIPRYSGDVSDPRGGIRNVIPEKGNYLKRETSETSTQITSPPLPHGRALITGDTDHLIRHLGIYFSVSESADLAVAFVLHAGTELIYDYLFDFLVRGGNLRLITGTYMGVTQPQALLPLLDLKQEFPDQVELRIFEVGDSSFHPKAYIFHLTDEDGAAFIGSSNISKSALTNGVEWNYRVITTVDPEGFSDVVKQFEKLFHHPDTKILNFEWIQNYRYRPVVTFPVPEVLIKEEVEPPPQPHQIQLAALEALNSTRATGNATGLVVMATGLGKTWLSAFDSNREEYQRILFVAHREEILAQAMKTFRRIRPNDYLGLYTGQEKHQEAKVLFASIQTLGKSKHLENFSQREFDYIVVDEFHHACAKTYQRLIKHFQPLFLLGLTATPERTDGGDLLALCGENLVYRCDLVQGIEQGLLSPFRYFGVPDEVDYRNIPWRSSHFDEEALTNAVSTQSRAQNAFEQYEKRAGSRTLAFCCSMRHADFMREFFRGKNVNCSAVHSGPTSDPRAESLERLTAGELDVVFAVDMFNEGVDLPNVDTVMMLRPTESRILWLQQFGRGLRKAEGKELLTVVDYIGNHRTFLLKTQTLFQLGAGDAEIRKALDALQAGTLELPPGCEVTYELEAVNIIRSLLRQPKDEEELRFYYEDFRERNETRPLAVEAFHDNYNPRAARSGYGSWLSFVRTMGDLNQKAIAVLNDSDTGKFLNSLEKTPMTRSYKMVVLLAMLNLDQFPGHASIDDLIGSVEKIIQRSSILSRDFGIEVVDRKALRRLLEENPINAWTGGRGTEGVPFFTYINGVLSSTLSTEGVDREAFQELVREIADWRLAEYLERSQSGAVDVVRFIGKVSISGSNALISLPDRAIVRGIPYGWIDLLVDGETLEGNFDNLALNVVRYPSRETNLLPNILKKWFDADVGMPGTRHQVAFEESEAGIKMRPLRAEENKGLSLWQRYTRQEIPELFGMTFNVGSWGQHGFIFQDKSIFLLVTLDKSDVPGEYRYGDRFLDPQRFEWQSQNRTTQNSSHGQAIRNHQSNGIAVHLFVRKQKKITGKPSPFVYCGDLEFQSWQGEKPITVQWRLKNPLPESLQKLFGVG